MLRIFLGTVFLLSSTFPALAEWSCGYCRAGGGEHPRLPGVMHAAYAAGIPDSAGMNSAMALSIIYPGVVVLLMMSAFYFLKVLEPQAHHGHPGFVKSAIALSGLWLIGFYPFLSSALGGFLFCVTAIACIGAWLLIRRFSVETRVWERMMVFWSFFFFSLVAGVVATGYGAGIGSFIGRTWHASREIGRASGPLLLVAMNVAAFLLALRIIGMKVPRPSQPETIVKLKIYALATAVVLLDMAGTETRYQLMAWAAAPLLALPSLAYYGAYWLVRRLPEAFRGRVSFVLFILLALYLILLACLAAGASAAAMLFFASALGLVVSLAQGLVILARSDARKSVKRLVFSGAAIVLAGAAVLTFMIITLPPPEQDPYIRSWLALELLGWKPLIGLIAAYAYGIYFIVTPAFSRRAKYALAALMSFVLLLGYAGAAFMEK